MQIRLMEAEFKEQGMDTNPNVDLDAGFYDRPVISKAGNGPKLPLIKQSRLGNRRQQRRLTALDVTRDHSAVGGASRQPAAAAGAAAAALSSAGSLSGRDQTLVATGRMLQWGKGKTNGKGKKKADAAEPADAPASAPGPAQVISVRTADRIGNCR